MCEREKGLGNGLWLVFVLEIEISLLGLGAIFGPGVLTFVGPSMAQSFFFFVPLLEPLVWVMLLWINCKLSFRSYN